MEVGPSQAERAIRLIVGMHPSSLLNEIVHYEEIQSHLERGHDLGDLLRWSNSAGLIVFRTKDGTCVSVRKVACPCT